MFQELETVETRYSELDELLGDGEVVKDQKRYREIAREHSGLSEVVDSYRNYKRIGEEIRQNKELLHDDSEEIRELARSEIAALEGDLSANENGIESLVYLPELSTQGISIKSKSVVDYIYFSTNNPPSQTVIGMPSWFRLDDEHLSVYGIS